MIRLLSEFRLIPVVLVAAICLFTLKTFGLVFEGGYTLTAPAGDDADITGAVGLPKRGDLPPRPAVKQAPQKSWAQQMFNYPDVTGSVPETKTPPKAEEGGHAAPKQPATKPPEEEKTAKQPPEKTLSPAERAILERLQERRGELEERERQLDLRESLIKAAEKRLEGRIGELKELEDRVNGAVQAKSDGEAARFKQLVTMYDNMKAKDAAKIFDRLDMRVLLQVATQINPRRMSDILAQMTPDTAERLTVEIAARSKDKPETADLPKIEGKPTN